MNYSKADIIEYYVPWANTLDSAGEDSGPALERLIGDQTIELVFHNMRDIIRLAEFSDMIKKWVFYGKTTERIVPVDNRIPRLLREEGSKNFHNHNNIRVFHALLGLL